MTRLRGTVLALLVLGACDDGAKDDDDDTDTDTVETDTDGETDTDTDTDVDSDTDTDAVVTDPCLAEPTVVEVGTGEGAFESLTPGQDLEMVNGPQGGWHHNVGVRVENSPQFVVIEVRAIDVASGDVVTITTDPDQEPDGPLRKPVALVPPVFGQWDCSGEYVPIQAVLDFSKLGVADSDSEPWSVLCGTDLTLEVSIRLPGEGGRVLASDSVTVVSQPDPDNGPHCE